MCCDWFDLLSKDGAPVIYSMWMRFGGVRTWTQTEKFDVHVKTNYNYTLEKNGHIWLMSIGLLCVHPWHRCILLCLHVMRIGVGVM